MIFFRTPLQRRILKNYWSNNEPFTIDSLCEQRIVRNHLWGSFSLKMMLRKYQIIQSIDKRDGKEKFIGTTDSIQKWRGLILEKRLAENPLLIVEDFGLSGLNKSENDPSIDEMKEIIERKKQEIPARKRQKARKRYRGNPALKYLPLARLDRAADSDARRRKHKPSRARQLKRRLFPFMRIFDNILPCTLILLVKP